MSANEFLLRTGNAILGVIRVGNRLRDGSHRRQWVEWSQRPSESEGRKGVVMSGSWVWFRNYFWREQVGEEITLFMESFVVTLRR